ncbi:MAG: FtsX-like permease family protein [Methanobacteriota archaeon]
MILRGPIGVAIALLTVVLALSVAFGEGLGRSPRFLLGDAPGLMVIFEPANPNPLKSRVDVSIAHFVAGSELVLGASPEIYAPAMVDRRPVLVRGLEPASFVALAEEEYRLEGAWPSAGEAVAGERLARAFDLEVGDRLTVSGSWRATFRSFRVSGLVAAEGPAGDELLVALSDARALTNVAPGEANLIRLRSSEPPRVSELLAASGPEFTVENLTVEPARPIPREQAFARVRIGNWGPVGGTKPLTLRIDNETIAERAVHVPARSWVEVEFPFTVATPGTHVVRVNPNRTIEVAVPNLTVQGLPEVVGTNATWWSNVVTEQGALVPGTTVAWDGGSAVAAENASFAWSTPRAGRYTLVLTGPQGERGTFRVRAVDPDYLYLPSFRVVSFSVVPSPVEAGRPASAVVRFANDGGAPGEASADVVVDGVAAGSGTIRIGSLDEADLLIPVATSAVGQHRAAFGPHSADYNVVPAAARPSTPLPPELSPDAPPPPPVEAAPPPLAATAGQDIESFLSETIGNVKLAVAAFSAAALLLTAMGVASVVSRELAARASVVGTLRSIGASPGFLLVQAARDALLVCAWSVPAGILAATVVMEALSRWGLLRGFGHAIVPVWGVEPAIRVAVAMIATVLVVALVRLRSQVRETIVSSVRRAPSAGESAVPLSRALGEAR